MHVSARNHPQAPQRVAARPAREHYLRERRSSFSTSSMAIIAVLARDEPWCACPRPPCPLALLILHHSSCRRFIRREAPRQNKRLLQVARSRSSTMRTASCISVLTPSIVLHSPPFPPQVHLVCFTACRFNAWLPLKNEDGPHCSTVARGSWKTSLDALCVHLTCSSRSVSSSHVCVVTRLCVYVGVWAAELELRRPYVARSSCA